MAMLLVVPTCAQGGPGIRLSVTSPQDRTPFVATCTVNGPEGERTEIYRRVTPLEVAFDGARELRCRIESAGPLDVLALGPGGSVSRTRTSGGTVTIALSG